eukprot:6290587-Prymnesium_polylepis.3
MEISVVHDLLNPRRRGPVGLGKGGARVAGEKGARVLRRTTAGGRERGARRGSDGRCTNRLRVACDATPTTGGDPQANGGTRGGPPRGSRAAPSAQCAVAAHVSSAGRTGLFGMSAASRSQSSAQQLKPSQKPSLCAVSRSPVDLTEYPPGGGEGQAGGSAESGGATFGAQGVRAAGAPLCSTANGAGRGGWGQLRGWNMDIRVPPDGRWRKRFVGVVCEPE